MSTTAELDEPKMATKRDDVPVKVDAGVIARAKIAAAARGLSLAEYVSETLRPIVESDIKAFAHSQLEGAPTPRKPKGSK